jgi:5,10-methylenetetrahydromethanopterin reductase
MTLEISCAFATSMQSHEHARIAEQLGYKRAYFYDSPAFYPDLWVQVCRAAELTTTIGFGTAVMVPNCRHVMTTAAALAMVAEVAGTERPNFALGIGTGFTARLAMGQRPLKWAFVRAYAVALRSLLQGETVEWEGAPIKMLHPHGFGAPRPVDIEILIAAAGPKGEAVAREVGDGVFAGLAPVAGFERAAYLTLGTVLREREDPGSDRVIAAAGHAATGGAHWSIEFGGEGGFGPVEDMTGDGARWRAAYADVPREELHLALHEGHMMYVNERDRPFVTGDLMVQLGLALDADGWRRKLADFEAQGASEIVFTPGGDNIPGELEAFFEVAQARVGA